ncbi:glycosyltransferase family 2 protein [Rhodospirillum rubrum]|uniref:Glycosyl transferase, family 2 n=2 Tax=Rhodospirillum rubrum TaxID=1085 RepID=Q2RQ74_RHORT|nr:glycosyltransferase family 2 protein [Rhodospirillum rubrum]ABC23721.1 Glycosyl transferase, family 2 [Rhodospirillum rubrum ATCC 11170]AEO49460.1 glycosyl transferase family protein [Rhodospirillum rubrum F11]MBK5955397.1 glycosyl transferase [Rhodospirillum rubrum]QXG79677.1 glycosyltransferase [Rhodospirillum rubrum]HAP98921.1 glycosyltransferase family 2 protein [Rhodospirillum rubrum]
MDDASPTLASVIIPAFNAEAVLEQAVDSVRASIAHCAAHLAAAPAGAFEIILVDDASTDATLALARRLAAEDPRITVIARRRNGGAGPARNAGARAAKGEILFYLDADDGFLPPHVLACLQELLRHPEAGLVKTGIAVDFPLTEEWRQALIVSVVFNTALWKRCHEAIGGFMEDPELCVLRCEDVFYCDLLMRAFPARGIEAQTVRHTLRPGGAFDGQRAKFSAPPGEGPESLTPAQSAVLPLIRARHAERLARLGLEDAEA